MLLVARQFYFIGCSNFPRTKPRNAATRANCSSIRGWMSILGQLRNLANYEARGQAAGNRSVIASDSEAIQREMRTGLLRRLWICSTANLSLPLVFEVIKNYARISTLDCYLQPSCRSRNNSAILQARPRSFEARFARAPQDDGIVYASSKLNCFNVVGSAVRFDASRISIPTIRPSSCSPRRCRRRLPRCP